MPETGCRLEATCLSYRASPPPQPGTSTHSGPRSSGLTQNLATPAVLTLVVRLCSQGRDSALRPQSKGLPRFHVERRSPSLSETGWSTARAAMTWRAADCAITASAFRCSVGGGGGQHRDESPAPPWGCRRVARAERAPNEGVRLDRQSVVWERV